MTLERTDKTEKRFLQKTLAKRQARMLEPTFIVSQHATLTPLNATVDTWGGSKRLENLRLFLPLNTVLGGLGIAPLNILTLSALSHPGDAIMAAGVGLVTVVLAAFAGVGVREQMLVNRLQPWVETTTVEALQAWLKTHRGIELSPGDLPNLRLAVNLINGSYSSNDVCLYPFEDINGEKYFMRRATSDSPLEIEDKWGVNILTTAGWAQHQSAVQASTGNRKSAAIPVLNPTKKLASKKYTSVLNSSESARLQTARDKLTPLLTTKQSVEIQHAVDRVHELIKDFIHMDEKLTDLSARSQRLGKRSLLDTLNIIEAEIEDIKTQMEQGTVKQAAVLAGYAKNLRGNTSLSLPASQDQG